MEHNNNNNPSTSSVVSQLARAIAVHKGWIKPEPEDTPEEEEALVERNSLPLKDRVPWRNPPRRRFVYMDYIDECFVAETYEVPVDEVRWWNEGPGTYPDEGKPVDPYWIGERDM